MPIPGVVIVKGETLVADEQVVITQHGKDLVCTVQLMESKVWAVHPKLINEGRVCIWPRDKIAKYNSRKASPQPKYKLVRAREATGLYPVLYEGRTLKVVPRWGQSPEFWDGGAKVKVPDNDFVIIKIEETHPAAATKPSLWKRPLKTLGIVK
ncbi:MAG: hypothetical protein Q8P13_04945 [bacterium]|nr:hypothetical protein [bacterium]